MQKMDIYLPSNKGEVNVVLCIHGGGWCTGDKISDADICNKATEFGYVAVSMNYRMLNPYLFLPHWTQSVNYLDMLNDIGNAIATIKNKLLEEDYIPKKLAITGWSAGGHLSLLYGYSRYQESSIRIAFLSADCAPTDFLDAAYLSLHKKSIVNMLSALAGQKISYQNVLDRVQVLRDMSPLYSVVSGVPPTLMRHGKQDKMVPISQAITLQTALDVANIQNDLFIYPDSGHDLDNNTEISNAYIAKLQEYLNMYFLKKGSNTNEYSKNT
jgi:acetyl esterase/lipase